MPGGEERQELAQRSPGQGLAANHQACRGAGRTLASANCLSRVQGTRRSLAGTEPVGAVFTAERSPEQRGWGTRGAASGLVHGPSRCLRCKVPVGGRGAGKPEPAARRRRRGAEPYGAGSGSDPVERQTQRGEVTRGRRLVPKSSSRFQSGPEPPAAPRGSKRRQVPKPAASLCPRPGPVPGSQRLGIGTSKRSQTPSLSSRL